MRTLLKILYVALSLIIFFGAVLLAYELVEVYLLASGTFLPGETIEYLERPARTPSELVVRVVTILAVTCLAALVQWRLKRWLSSEPNVISSKSTAEEETKFSEPPGSDDNLT